MTSLWAVKNFDVIECITTGIFSRGVDFYLDSLPFQQLEKTLSYDVVVAVALVAHAETSLLAFKRLR